MFYSENLTTGYSLQCHTTNENTYFESTDLYDHYYDIFLIYYNCTYAYRGICIGCLKQIKHEAVTKSFSQCEQ